MCRVSFILPCYNVGRFITDTLGSLYAQGMPEDEFEVIRVNVCSRMIPTIESLRLRKTMLISSFWTSPGICTRVPPETGVWTLPRVTTSGSSMPMT